MKKPRRDRHPLLLTVFLAAFVLLPGLAATQQSQPVNVVPPPPSLPVFLAILSATPDTPPEEIISCAASQCPLGQFCYYCYGNYYCFYPPENGGAPNGCQGGGPQ